MTKPTLQKPPKEFDAIVDMVLAYKPKAKSKPAKKRKRRAAKASKKLNAELELSSQKPISQNDKSAD